MPMGCRIDFFITILFEAIANFRSSDPTVGYTEQGFSVWKQTPFPTNYTLDSAVSDFISRQCIRCLVDNIHWESQTLDGVQSTCLLADQDELNHRVADFLRDLEAPPCNAGQTELSVRLTILQEITLPAEEFVEWTSWYYDQAAMRSESFVEEYKRAIMEQRRRHREIEEGLDQVSSGWLDMTGLEEVCYEKGDAKEQCSICLEEFVAGSSITRLPCFHV
ncbi:hypothetical protein C3L33_04757, partial [Rhododendron williamsianum]